MTPVYACLAPFLALWFWTRTAPAPDTRWPDALPRFADGPVAFTCTPSDGAVFAHVTIPQTSADAQAAILRAFSEAGWTCLPVRGTDFFLFARGEAVAAVRTAETGAGTRVTVIQRRNGLAPVVTP